LSCARVHQVLDAYVDGELDPATVAELDEHLASCTACAALRAERLALGAEIRAAAAYHPAPPGLRAAIERSLPRPERAASRRPSWAIAGALAAGAAVTGLAAGLFLGRLPPADPALDEVVASHVASLAPDRKLVDVASSDRHVVKPWFAGRSDFAPLVRDLSRDGFLLLGARFDHVGRRQAAAVVYKLRNHYINLFAWRGSGDDAPVEFTTARGFAVATWAAGGVRFAAISDLEAGDLARFARLMTASP